MNRRMIREGLRSKEMGSASDQSEHSGKAPEFGTSCECLQRRWMHWICLAAGLLCLAAISAQRAGAQAYIGSITGVVTDPSGAVIAGASVVAKNMSTGFTYPTKTNAEGIYTLPNLPPATYQITVTAPGFKEFVRPGVVIAVAQNVAVDAALELGAATQSVTVKGVSPLLQTQNGSTGETVDRNFINDLPLIGRSVLDLAFLAPGVSPPPTSAYGPGYGNDFVSNGGRNMTADVMLDGTSATAPEQNTMILNPLYIPSVDMVQEFQLEQNGFSAAKGFSGNTVINVVMQSGTNQFHGDAYEFNQNSGIDANNWFSNQAGLPLPVFRTNDFGFTLGGPIQKNKTFFFVDYNGVRSSSAGAYAGAVPSVAERNGDFGEVCANMGLADTGVPGSFDSTGMCSDPNGQLWDPYSGFYNSSIGARQLTAIIPDNNLATYESPGTPLLAGTPYALHATPGNLINPVAYKSFQYFPLPNLNVGTSAYNPFDNWAATGTGISNADRLDIKVDRQITDMTHLMARFSEEWDFNTNTLPAWNSPMDPNLMSLNRTGRVSAVLSVTHNFSPELLLSATYGYTRYRQIDPGIVAEFPSFDPITTLGLPAYMTTSGYDLPPSYGIGGGYNTSLGGMNSLEDSYALETHDLSVNLDKTFGKHDLKFGGEMRMFRTAFEMGGSPDGYFYWDQTGTSQTPLGGTGGDGLASFLTGLPESGQYEIPLAAETQAFDYAGYIQDTWHVTPHLTLSPGLRYDLYLPATSRFNQQSWFNPTVVNPISNDHLALSQAAAADFSTVGLPVPNLSTMYGGLQFCSPGNRYVVNPVYTNFSPRLGFAYNIHQGIVIRGSYGIFYSTPDYTAHGTGLGDIAGFEPYTFTLTTMNNNGYTPWGSLSNPFPAPNFSTASNAGLILPSGSSLGLLTNEGVGLQVPYLRTWNQVPYVQAWNFGIQHQFGSVLVDVEYVGSKGTHLYFADGGSLSYLGPQVEHYSPAQIQALESYVPNPFAGLISTPGSGMDGPYIQAVQLAVPFPEFAGPGGVDPPFANSNYNALQLKVEKHLSHGLEVLANYTWEKTLDDASVSSPSTAWVGGIDITPQDPNNRHQEYSLSEYQVPQVLNFAYIYELPFGRKQHWGRSWSGPLNVILGGWQTQGFWRFDDGQPLEFSSCCGISLPTYGPQRPNFSGPIYRNTGSETSMVNQYFANPQVASLAAPYTLGNGPRVSNIFAPGTRNAALSLFKEIPIRKLGEAGRLELRLEAFNAFNHVQFGMPNTSVGQGSFGLITYQANSPRAAQIGAKVYW